MRYVSLAFVLIVSLPRLLAQVSGMTTIDGHVVGNDGSPVEAALVEVHPLAAYEGIVPDSVNTGKDGAFHIVFPALGEAWLSASKVSEGYPNAALAIYGRGRSGSLKKIDLRPGAVVSEELRFGKPNAVIDITVVGDREEPVLTSRLLVEWPENSDYMTSSTIPANGMFHVVVPEHPIAMTISAPGFTSWKYHDEKSGMASLIAQPGAHINLTVQLRPIPKI